MDEKMTDRQFMRFAGSVLDRIEDLERDKALTDAMFVLLCKECGISLEATIKLRKEAIKAVVQMKFCQEAKEAMCEKESAVEH